MTTRQSGQTEITLRLILEQPVAGVVYSLQNKKNEPVNATLSAGADLAFELPVRVGPGPKFYGDFVRSEGPSRRFVYVASGKQAGQHIVLSRRMKIDIHDLPQTLIDAAIAGRTLQAVFAGSDRDGGPACATCKPIEPWETV